MNKKKTDIVRLLPNQNTCPKCGSDWDGGSIVETFIKQREEGNLFWKDKTNEDIELIVKETYSPPYRWDRKIGVELSWDHPKHIDGISYWKCPDCDALFDRFTGFEVNETDI